MNKPLLLKISISVNLVIMLLFLFMYFFHPQSQYTSYFHIGWSDDFIFIGMPIDSPIRYFSLCGFIVIMNVSEILMDNIAVPLIQFSTYNPYKSNISDFTRLELELFSNMLFFIQISKRLIQVFIILSQIDIAIISASSSQISAFIAIHYLLDQKTFTNDVSTNHLNQNYRIVYDSFPINI